MKYYICTFADSDKKVAGMLTTYQVREELNDPTPEEIDAALLHNAMNGKFKRAFLFDETLTKNPRWAYQWHGRMFIEDELGIDGCGAIDKDVLSVIF